MDSTGALFKFHSRYGVLNFQICEKLHQNAIKNYLKNPQGVSTYLR